MNGTYCLCVAVKEELSLTVGALGKLSFKPGSYIYVGSALNGLEARIQRHIQSNRGRPGKVHWHIDYLLRAPKVKVEAVYTCQSSERVECAVAEAVGQKGLPVKRFGCSDCRCVSHLFKVDRFEFLAELGLKLMDHEALQESLHAELNKLNSL